MLAVAKRKDLFGGEFESLVLDAWGRFEANVYT